MARKNQKFLLFFIAITSCLTGIMIGIFSVFFLIDNKVNNKAEEILNSDSYISKLNSEIKPYIIFDINTHIISNMGGMKYIKNIQVEKSKTKKNPKHSIYKFIIEFKQCLSLPPILSNLSQVFEYEIQSSKGNNLKWIYTLNENAFLYYEDKTRTKEIPIFKLEIIK